MPEPLVVAFHVEWFDKQASLVQTFRLNHFQDGTIEMMNMKTGKTFLKRTYFPDVTRAALFKGAAVTIHCRQLHLVDYADEGTRLYYSSTTVRVFGLIKPEAMGEMGSLISKLQNMFTLNRMKMVNVDNFAAQKFSCQRGMGIAVEATVSGEEGSQWNDLIASDTSTFYGSTGDEFVAEDSRLTFGAQSQTRGGSRNSEVTTCIIKPHIIKNGQLGELMSNITSLEADGIRIEELEMFNFDKTAAASFFDVYKGLFTYYEKMIDHMIEGPSVYLKLSGNNVVETFREFCGPSDVEVARHLRPKSLRAQFGTDRVRNAIHCTDLPEDGSLECSYMDKILHL